MKITIKTFDELSKEELYEILALRSEVFIVEQICAYQDVDGKDTIAYHLMCVEEDKLIGYLRIFKSGDYFENASIGRVLVKKEQRKKGIAYTIMKKALHFVFHEIQEKRIELSAQCYLTNFYENLGFYCKGDEYLEDGIPHIKMVMLSKS